MWSLIDRVDKRTGYGQLYLRRILCATFSQGEVPEKMALKAQLARSKAELGKIEKTLMMSRRDGDFTVNEILEARRDELDNEVRTAVNSLRESRRAS